MNEQLHNLKLWLNKNERRLQGYYPDKNVGHESIDAVAILHLIVSNIKDGNLNAVEIGCDFLIADLKTPFGKITKSHLFNALRSQVSYINKERMHLLTCLAKKYIELPYPPQETKDLMRLVKEFEARYVSEIILSSNPISSVGQKHIEYLRSKQQ